MDITYLMQPPYNLSAKDILLRVQIYKERLDDPGQVVICEDEIPRNTSRRARILAIYTNVLKVAKRISDPLFDNLKPQDGEPLRRAVRRAYRTIKTSDHALVVELRRRLKWHQRALP